MKYLILSIACLLLSFQLFTIQSVIKDIEALQQVKEVPYTPKRYKVLSESSTKEEIKLAELFNKRAENIENEGFFRFAITLRNIAKHYFSEAERIKEDY